jgi:MoaA/NifB/PqqE/SkfB family radical SAM enzyme
MNNQAHNYSKNQESKLSDYFHDNILEGLEGSCILTDEMNFVDSMHALSRVYTRESWFRSVGTKPTISHPSPFAVQLEFTQRCNLACDFCYNESGPKNTNELDLETLDRLCSEVIELDVGEVIISGGEPLMKPRHLDLILDRIGSKGIPIHILTNGILLDRKWLNKFEKAGVATIQVSLDGGDPKIHDRIRGKKGSWSKALQGLAMAHGAGFHTFVSTVLTRGNASTLPALVEACYLCGCDNLNVGDLISWGRGNQFIDGSKNTDGSCTDEQFDWAAEHLIKQDRLYGNKMTVRLAVNMYFFICQLKIKGQESILIRGDGSVRPHCTLSGIVAGNINEKPLREIWEQDLSNIHTNPVMDSILKDHVATATEKLGQLRCHRRAVQ